ncbi:MAG: hypothetical protein OIF51_01315 [Cellvibrionaceae bacterium]|nr:hypothetical protein [Cellvibrionaceae bacterium]
MKSVIFSLLASLTVLTAFAEDSQEIFTPYKHKGEKFPAVFFVSNIQKETYLNKLKQHEAFDRLDKEAIGLPIGLRVYKGRHVKQDGTQFSSVMLSATTLGLLPVVSNTEFTLYYDVFVQGKLLERFEYSMDSTQVNNIWTNPHGSDETKPAEEVFMETSIDRFLHDLSKSEKAKKLFSEYREYFSPEA